MKANYPQWLEQLNKYQANSIATRISHARRVEEYHGDLDAHYIMDRMASLLETLTYSTDAKQHARPNPSPIPINGDLYDNLASYRQAVRRYLEFRDSGDYGVGTPASEGVGPTGAVASAEEAGQWFGRERDLQWTVLHGRDIDHAGAWLPTLSTNSCPWRVSIN